MATHLDLEEQEQLDQLKAFWKQYGNLITWVLIACLGTYAAWNGWNWWQRDQATKAAAMFDELERAATAGDAQRAGQIFGDLKERYARTVYAEQGGLLAARLTELDGASAYVQGGAVTYSNEAKTEVLGVPAEMIADGLAGAETQLARLPSRLRRGIYGLPPGLDEYEPLQRLAVPPAD